MSMASSRGRTRKTHGGLLNLVPQDRCLFEIFLFNCLGEFFLQNLQSIGKIPALAQRLRNFAHMPCAFVHRLEESIQRLGKSVVTFRPPTPASLLEIRLCEPATAALNLASSRRLFNLLRSSQAKEQISQRK